MSSATNREVGAGEPDWLATTRRLLETEALGCVLEGHAEIDSTNARALEWAADGAPHGATVVADRQTRGRGRLGRTWVGGEGTSLLVSVLVRPVVSDDAWGLLPLAAGLAVSDALATHVGDAEGPRLKWPNDVLLAGRKVAGILVESVMARSRWAVIGVGINVNQSAMPAELAASATSLRVETGEIISRGVLLAAVLQALEARLAGLQQDPAGLIRAYAGRLQGIDAPVMVSEVHGGQVEGIAKGVDHTGALVVSTAEGERVFRAGEVTLRRAT